METVHGTSLDPSLPSITMPSITTTLGPEGVQKLSSYGQHVCV